MLNTKETHYFESILLKVPIRYIVLWLFIVIVMGLSVCVVFIRSLPDGKTLKIIFCNVGQGDAIYLLFPNGRDMLIDGGPDGSVLTCLGKYKPFWDRSIDIVLYTHPDLDHFGGLLSVIRRYSIGMLIHTHVVNPTSEYMQLQELIRLKRIPEIFVVAGDKLEIANVVLYWLWPSEQLDSSVSFLESVKELHVHGKEWDTNDLSQIIHLRYKTFDALLTGDAGISVASYYQHQLLITDSIEVLKVPHHGSLDAINEAYLQWLKPQTAVLSVGKKNRYGHPRPEILTLLNQYNIKVYSTAQLGTFMMTTDGTHVSYPH